MEVDVVLPFSPMREVLPLEPINDEPLLEEVVLCGRAWAVAQKATRIAAAPTFMAQKITWTMEGLAALYIFARAIWQAIMNCGISCFT